MAYLNINGTPVFENDPADNDDSNFYTRSSSEDKNLDAMVQDYLLKASDAANNWPYYGGDKIRIFNKGLCIIKMNTGESEEYYKNILNSLEVSEENTFVLHLSFNNFGNTGEVSAWQITKDRHSQVYFEHLISYKCQ